jgi:hypothetical protein
MALALWLFRGRNCGYGQVMPNARWRAATGVPPDTVSFPLVRDRPDRASPRKTKKSGDFPARKPGEPSVTRKIGFHLLSPQIIS